MASHTVSAINNHVRNNAAEYIAQVEKEFDDSLNTAVDEITSDSNHDIVLLAGPSSSGKTTTANILVKKIRERNINSLRVSLDDFYIDRDSIPLTKDGIKDFENVDALDIDLIHSVFKSLIEKRKAELPEYDFTTGKRKDETFFVELGKNDVIVVEGIHALNPVITAGLGSSHVYKIYISVSSRVTENDGKVLLSKRNMRLIRRMLRDYNHRDCPVENTFMQWPGVLKGEDKYIFPYESNADIRVDSFHPYEPCLFKSSALELFNEVQKDSECYDRVCEIKQILSKFDDIEPSLLPKDSLLNEFMSK